MINKQSKQQRRARKTRAKIKELNMVRLTVHRALNNIYAQLITPCGEKIIASASTTEKVIKESIKHGGNKAAAIAVGQAIAERGKKAGVTKVAFDRSGYKYHGRVAALADAARKGGIEF